MQILVLVIFTALMVMASGCSNECKSGEAKSGEKCVALRDASSGRDDLAEDPATDGEDDVDHLDDASVGAPPQSAQDGGASNDLSGLQDIGDGSTDYRLESGIADVCHPNPCGRGTCSVDGEGFKCACERDWSPAPRCTVNTNADLSNLTLSAGTLFPAFRSDIREYSVDLGIAESTVSFTATAAQPTGASVRIGQVVVPSGMKGPDIHVELNEEARRMDVRVEANDGVSSRTYSFTIRRTLTKRDELTTSGLAGIALAGDRMVIGDPGNNEVDLYVRSAGKWTYQYSVKNSGGLVSANFGQTVALNSDWLAIGAPDADAALVVSMANGQRYPLAIAASLAGIKFGSTVSLSGGRLVVLNSGRAAATGVTAQPGGAFVYEFNGSTWTQVARLAPDPSEAAECMSAAIEGDLIALGCFTSGNPQGAVLLFERANGAWMRTSTLRSPLANEPSFGTAVNISRGRVAVTAGYFCVEGTDPCRGTANVYVFSRSTNAAWNPPVSFGLDTGSSTPRRSLPFMFGLAMAFDGNRILVSAAFQHGDYGINLTRTVGNQAEALGGALLFGETASGWDLIAQIGPPAAASGSIVRMFAGTSLALGVETIAVWAAVDASGTNAAVYVLGPDCKQIPGAAAVPGC